MSNLVPYQQPNRQPDVGMLPLFERREARQDLARQWFDIDRSHEVELVRYQHQREMAVYQHEDRLTGLERQAETETFQAAVLANRFRNLQNLAGGVADWCEYAASDYEARCQRTPSAAPFLARLLQITSDAQANALGTYGSGRGVY
jgi:hypothetical protein